jgi:hypothetical protein
MQINQLHSHGALMRGEQAGAGTCHQASSHLLDLCQRECQGSPEGRSPGFQGLPVCTAVVVVGLLRGNHQLGQRLGPTSQLAGEGRISVGPDGTTEMAIYNPTATAIALHGSSRLASIELRDLPGGETGTGRGTGRPGAGAASEEWEARTRPLPSGSGRSSGPCCMETRLGA